MMKKILVFLCAIIFIFGMVSQAGATPITFTDTTIFYSDGTDPDGDLNSYGGSSVNKLEYLTDWVSWTHHFDFDPAASEILSGSLEITFTDDDKDKWWNIFSFEWALGWGEDWSFDFGEIDTGTVGPYSLNVDYLADGEFTATVASLWGDFFIEQSDLEITYEPASVPEPATMLLLGTGIIGLAGFRKKFKK